MNWDASTKPRGYIQWVDGAESAPVEIRLYDHLFKSPIVPVIKESDSADLKLGDQEWIADLNPNSLTLVKDALIDSYTAAHKTVGDRLQFERVGYFVVDADSAAGRPVWNRIVTLKEANWSEK